VRVGARRKRFRNTRCTRSSRRGVRRRAGFGRSSLCRVAQCPSNPPNRRALPESKGYGGFVFGLGGDLALLDLTRREAGMVIQQSDLSEVFDDDDRGLRRRISELTDRETTERRLCRVREPDLHTRTLGPEEVPWGPSNGQ